MFQYLFQTAAPIPDENSLTALFSRGDAVQSSFVARTDRDYNAIDHYSKHK